MKRFVFVLLLVVACSKKQEAPPLAGSGSGSGSSVAVSPLDAAPAPPAANAELLPAKLADKQGVVFAEKQGDQVTATVKGQTVLIPDGTKVEIAAEKDVGVGGGDEASVTVKFGSQEVELKADRVLVEGALKRSADSKHAVFTIVTGCGDVCHTAIYLLSVDGKRTKLGEGGPDTTVAWTADKVAVGNGDLYIATLANHEVKSLPEYTSPAYSPEGVLYARNHDGAAFKVEGDKPTQVWKPKQKRKIADDGEGDMMQEDPAPVRFEGGKPKFDL
ncbi:MAG: hypothetical protein M3619_10080 [Myxococcota bacterium]|nr:hypothetical protein [Myxococcota bacterium]